MKRHLIQAISLSLRLNLCLGVLSACQGTPTLPERKSVSFEPDLLDPLGPPPALNHFEANLPNQLPVFGFLNQGNQLSLNLTQFNQEGQRQSPVPTAISISAQDDANILQRSDLQLSAFSLARLLEPELSLSLPEYGQVFAPLQPAGQDRSRLQQTVLISTYESQGKRLLTDPNSFVISGQKSFLDSLQSRSLRLKPDSQSPDWKQETLQQLWLEGVQLPITHAAINANGELLLELDMLRRYFFGSVLNKQQAQVSFRQADYDSTKDQLRALILREPQAYLLNLATEPSQFSVVQVRLNNRPINLNATLSALTSSEREQFQIKQDSLLKATDNVRRRLSRQPTADVSPGNAELQRHRPTGSEPAAATVWQPAWLGSEPAGPPGSVCRAQPGLDHAQS